MQGTTTTCICINRYVAVYPRYPATGNTSDGQRILTSLEFHHREDLPQPPSLVATVLSRSTFDLTEVSLSPLPVIALIEFAFQCLSLEVLYRSSLMWLVRTEQQKECI